MANLTNRVAGDTAFEVIDPATSEPSGLSVTLRHKTSPEVRAVDRKWSSFMLKGRRLSVEQLEARQTDTVIAHIAGWTWGNDPNGEPFALDGYTDEFTELNVRRVLKAYPWIRDQVDSQANVEADFYKG